MPMVKRRCALSSRAPKVYPAHEFCHKPIMRFLWPFFAVAVINLDAEPDALVDEPLAVGAFFA